MQKVLLFLLFLFCFNFSQGQTGIISGRVINQKDGEPLSGATILLSQKNTGSVSDALGNYKITNVDFGNYTLTASFIGYETVTQDVGVNSTKALVVDFELKPGSLQLADVTVTANTSKNLTTISAIDIKLRPINTAQDVLRMVPGLFIAQHAGGGKAEQIFLRGFDCDHGTDINLSVDGLPVNMVSHAHGQGYSDLHFIIPETIESVDFNKGPYYADKGNFTTAGYVAFKTKNILDRNLIKYESGQFGLNRGLAMINLLNKSTANRFKQSAFVAAEYSHTNGFFVSPQDFGRLNVLGKYTAWWNSRNMLNITLSDFDSKWNASGQIPDRAVADGAITRFGAIDPTEGGSTQRVNASLKQVHTFGNGGILENQVFFTKYDFSLYSNFTFFLKDSVNGDQINQAENRKIFGYNGSYTQESILFGKKITTHVGATYRHDLANNLRLAHTVKRKYLNDFKLGDLNETNASAFVSETINLSSSLSLNTALRYDYFSFGYTDKLLGLPKQTQTVQVLSPKVNLNFQANAKTSLYFKFGQGFHSNDTRVVVSQLGKDILPKATGFDVGTIWKPLDNLLINVAAWMLDLQQEFVYVGDDAIVEASGKSHRQGVDVSMRYQINSWLYADVDLNTTKPRSVAAPAGQNYIPLAPVFTSIGGLSAKNKGGWNGSLRYRYMADRPANDDNSLVAKGYFITDALVNFTQRKYEVGLSAENIFNIAWKEAQFATTSRLKNEPAPVTEIHFTPGTPFFLKARVSFFF
ncbi:MAG: TonB-dependent receptor [Bacteroidetes bacterium]|nr:TonB-dependent receptor [Bacteroidota bacterium]